MKAHGESAKYRVLVASPADADYLMASRALAWRAFEAATRSIVETAACPGCRGPLRDDSSKQLGGLDQAVTRTLDEARMVYGWTGFAQTRMATSDAWSVDELIA